MDTLGVASQVSETIRWRDRFAARLLLRGLAECRSGAFLVRLPDGRELNLGKTDAPEQVQLTVKRWRFFWRALTRNDIGVGESYMDDDWACSDLVALCRIFLRDQSLLESRSLWTLYTRLRNIWLWRAQANTLRGSRRNIAHHYDLSNDLYRLFLDDTMMYSCAVFDKPESSLETAQRSKLDEICRRLELAPGMHVLEIGCGWGGFALHAARHYGCRVTGITLSREQLELARQRIAEAGLQDLVEFQFCDYRKVSGVFDRVVSIEMFEAVGFEYYAAYFAAVARALKPGGRMFLQTITIPDQRFDRYRRDFDWIKKYIFPGGMLASVHRIATTLKHKTDLRIDWLRDIGVHYAETLACWRQRFFERLPEVRQLGFDDRFIRMWEFYLASCEAAFAVRHIGDAQVILSKPA